MKDREAWHAAVRVVTKSQTQWLDYNTTDRSQQLLSKSHRNILLWIGKHPGLATVELLTLGLDDPLFSGELSCVASRKKETYHLWQHVLWNPELQNTPRRTLKTVEYSLLRHRVQGESVPNKDPDFSDRPVLNHRLRDWLHVSNHSVVYDWVLQVGARRTNN